MTNSTTSSSYSQSARQSAPPTRRFRGDIQGLRAIAVLLVVLYHAGLPWLHGGYIGVDVFFVISGFLIGGHILDELDRTGGIRLVEFYGRRMRRLLPASLLVILSTLVLVRIFMPPLGWADVSTDGLFAAVAGANLWFAATGTDYLANDAPSVFQHYWSLGVEEQFYLVFPVTILVIFSAVRRNRTLLVWAIGLISVVSFVACTVVTELNQPYAFFLLPTRAWELGVGVLIAAASPFLTRLNSRMGAVCQWLGLAIIAVSAVLLDHDTVFPGYWAVLPVLGSGLFMLGGVRPSRYLPAFLTENKVSQFFGRTSYSLYLWHWPVLVIPALYSSSGLSAFQAIGLVVLAVVLAEVTERFVETPARNLNWLKRSNKHTYGAAAGAVLITLVACLSVSTMPTLATQSVAQPWKPGEAPVSVVPASSVPSNLLPPLEGADASVPVIYEDGCHGSVAARAPRVEECLYGAPEAGRSIALLGDSHAAQWFPALEKLSVERGYTLIPMTKSSCPASEVSVWNDALNRRYTECEEWRRHALEEIAERKPELVVIGNFQGQKPIHSENDPDAEFSQGVSKLLTSLPEGVRAVVLGDTPMHDVSPPICLSGALSTAGECARTVDGAVRSEWTAAIEESVRHTPAIFVDPLPWLCPGGTCHAILGNVLMYRDRHHLTVEASEALSGALGESLEGSGAIVGVTR